MNSIFNTFNASRIVGFDEVMDRLISPTQNKNWPPYNMIRTEDGNVVIEIAVAGFSKDQLLTRQEEKYLIVQGHQHDKRDYTFIHNGISQRNFKVKFLIADNMKVGDISLTNGLLTINVEKDKTQSTTITYDIKGGG